MNYSKLVDRLQGKRTTAWDIHYAAQAAVAAGEPAIILSVGDSISRRPT